GFIQDSTVSFVVRQCKGSGPPIEPIEGACCGQGCVNCVWSVYASEVVRYYNIVKDIEAKVSNANVRAYILAELRMKLKKS
ncbi:unnamed protein product, partial [Angiostrongylus costaricensis]|uniref:Oxidoreductase-like domain-containing protein n=1 Tax=Angiostrongylus costaricensis TaxID=334426 RepID=A0A0R3PP10_ANGCS